MTATPKELLAAARDLENHAYDMMQTHRHMESEDEQFVLWSKQHILADYIRSAVRADDDEPVTEGRFIALLPTLRTPAERKNNRKYEIDDIGIYISAEFSPSGSCFLDVFIRKNGAEKTGAAFLIDPTWGQFRSLCRALGLTLPEVQG